jgi:hypothetical protein
MHITRSFCRRLILTASSLTFEKYYFKTAGNIALSQQVPDIFLRSPYICSASCGEASVCVCKSVLIDIYRSVLKKWQGLLNAEHTVKDSIKLNVTGSFFFDFLAAGKCQTSVGLAKC